MCSAPKTGRCRGRHRLRPWRVYGAAPRPRRAPRAQGGGAARMSPSRRAGRTARFRSLPCNGGTGRAWVVDIERGEVRECRRARTSGTPAVAVDPAGRDRSSRLSSACSWLFTSAETTWSPREQQLASQRRSWRSSRAALVRRTRGRREYPRRHTHGRCRSASSAKYARPWCPEIARTIPRSIASLGDLSAP
jgi:hypothetical protein